MIKLSLFILFGVCTTTGCDDYESPDRNIGEEQEVQLFVDQYDPIKDEGQYWHPVMDTKPLRYWNCVEVIPIGNINALGETEKIRGLQYHLLCQSLAGLANKAVDEGRSQVGVWLHDHSGKESYKAAKLALENMGISQQGMQSGLELARNNYGPSDGVALQLKDLFDGYILTDVENNPESNIVASVASHIYNSIIVDVRDKDYYEEAGYTMTYDATQKTTRDAWNEFKEECNNKALVIMPVQTGQLREFAIKNDLFVVNINKEYSNPEAGQNVDLLDEILAWLEPNSPVYGWEHGVGEDQFVERVSRFGHMMIPYDHGYNTSLTSIAYKDRQPGLAKVHNPQFLDWDETGKKYVSFYLTDGDNVQWMMNGFSDANYYTHPDANTMRMSFGLPVDNLSMIAPDMLNVLFEKQEPHTSLVQTFGGGYNYIDNFGESVSRTEALESIAKKTSSHMRQHRIKVLALMAKDVKSEGSKEAYQAYVDDNDQLEGIISVQYTPYAGGQGEIMWVTNKKGYDIPVITVKYSIWDFGGNNNENEGTPNYIAEKIASNDSDNPFNLVAVHAWSGFNETGNNSGDIKGAGAAKLCADNFAEDVKVVNVEELIWRTRKHFRPEQTEKYLSEVF